jgi:Protein of unknown function (DUF2721)
MEFSSESVTKIIGAILVPVVMVSTCALLLNGVVLRYHAVENLLRSFNQEWWDLAVLRPDNGSAKIERIHHLEHLIPKLLRHHHLLHKVLVLIYASILIFILDMLAIAISESISISWSPHFVLVILLAGVGILCWSLTLTCYEVYASHNFMQIELKKSCRRCSLNQSGKRDRSSEQPDFAHRHLD